MKSSICTLIRPSSIISNFHRNKLKLGRFSLAFFLPYQTFQFGWYQNVFFSKLVYQNTLWKILCMRIVSDLEFHIIWLNWFSRRLRAELVDHFCGKIDQIGHNKMIFRKFSQIWSKMSKFGHAGSQTANHHGLTTEMTRLNILGVPNRDDSPES